MSEEEDSDLVSDQSKERARRSESPYSTIVEAFRTSTDGVSRLRGIHPMIGLCDHPIRLSVTNYNGVPIAACVTISPVPEIVIGEISLAAFTPRIRLQTIRSPTGAASFVDKDRLFVMVADSTRSDGIDLHVITKTFNIKSEHVTSCHHPTALNVWKPSSDGPYHLAIANSPGPLLKPSANAYRNVTTFYKWTGTYFDSYTQVNSFHVKDICPFSVAGKDYVVIVNYESSPGFHSVDSELFKFDPDEYKWYSVQKIKTTGAVDCEIFSLGPDNNREYFLTIANNMDKDVTTGAVWFNVDSVIYKFSNDKFVPFQCLKTAGATSIQAFEDSDDEKHSSSFVLAVAHLPGVQLFEYNGWKFVEAPVQLARGSLGPGVVSMAFTRLQQQPVLISVNPRMSSREPNVIRFDFIHQNLLKNWKKASHEWCDTVSKRINGGVSNLHSINSLLDGTFTVDQREPIVIKGDLTATGANLTVNGFFRAPAVHDSSTGQMFSHDMIAELDALNKQLITVESQIAALQETLNRAVTLEGNQVITGQYSFSDVDFQCRDSDRCVFQSINAHTLNGEDITKLPISVLRTDQDQVLSDDMVMEHVTVSGDVQVEGAVNGVNPRKVVLKNGNQFIPSPKIFSGPTAATVVHVMGLINEAVVNNRTILTKSGDQIVNSNIVMRAGLNTPNLNVVKVNGLELSPLLDDIVTVDGDQTIRGHKNYSSVRVSNLNLLSGGHIAGVDMPNLWKNVLWTAGGQAVLAPLTFTNATVSSNLRCEKLINGVVIPNNDMVLINRSAIVTGIKTFVAPSTMIDHMSVGNSINGIKKVDTGYSQWPDQLDILVKSYAQTLPIPRSFSAGMHLSGHSTVQGLVDGVDLSRFAGSVLKRNSTNFLPGDWILTGDNIVFENRVSVAGLVDNTNLTNLYWKSLKLTDKVISNFSPFHFRILSSPQFKLRTLNRMVIGRDLMTKNTRQIVIGVKTFPSGIQVAKNMTILGLLNGIDMKFLGDSLLRSGNQNIWGQKVIQGDVYVNNLIINRGVNGINLNDVVLLNSNVPQTLTGKKTFNAVTVNGPLNVTRVYVERDLNGIHVNDFFKATMLYDEPQVVTGLKHYSKVTIPKASNLDTNSVNGYNLKKIYWDAVLIDQPQTISGEKTFKGTQAFDQLVFHRYLDGVTDHELRYNWMQQGVNQVVDGNLVFNIGLSVNHNLDIMNGTISGVHISNLNRTVIKKDEPATINGQVTFARQVSVNGDIKVSGATQGIKLSRDVLTRNSNCTVSGNKRFMSLVNLDDSLQTNGLVNGVFIPELCSSAVRTVGDQVIRSQTLLRGNLNIDRSLFTNGRIDGVNLRHFNLSAVKKNEPALIYGRKKFDKLMLMSPLVVQGTFGGLLLNRLQSDYMSLTRDQIINTPLVFSNGVHLNSAKIDGSIFVKNGLINNISLRAIDRNSLKLFGNQVVTGPVIFAGDVRTRRDLKFMTYRSIINEVSIFNDLFLKTRPQNVIRGGLVFDADVEFKRNLDLAPGKGIQGVDVSEVARFMVTQVGNHSIEGHKHFSSLEVNDIVVSGTVSGLNITPSNVLLASSNQVIDGTITFGKGVRFLNNLNANLVNNVNLNTWYRRLVLNGYNNTIPARKSFIGPVSINQAWAMKLIDNVHLTTLRNNIYQRFDTNQLQTHLTFQENKLKMLDQVLENCAMHLNHYATDRILHETLLKSTEFAAKKFIVSKQLADSGCSRINLYGVPSNRFSIVGSATSYNPVLSAALKLNGTIIVLVITDRISDLNSVSRCIPKVPKNIAIGSSVIQFLSFNPVARKLDQLNVLPIESLVTDIKVVSLTDHEACIVVAVPFIKTPAGTKLSNPKIICVDSHGKFIVSSNRVNGKGANKLAEHVSPAVTFLAVSSLQTSFVNILSWDKKTKSTSQPLQSIHVTSSNSVAFITTSIEEGNQVYLMVGGSSPSIIRVFKYIPSSKQRPFSEVQQIDIPSPVASIESVLLPDHSTLVFILLTDGEVSLYAYKGSSGFVPLSGIEPISRMANSLSVTPTFKNAKLTGHLVAINNRRSQFGVYEDEDETVLLYPILTY